MPGIPKISRSLRGEIQLNGCVLNVRKWTLSEVKGDGDPVSVGDAFAELAAVASLQHLVIGVIGPSEANAAQIAAAKKIGARLASLGLTLICGGRTGVMRAVSEGCNSVDGLLIGILPGNHPNEANEFVSIPLPTGLGEARNMVIAKAARVLIAVGGSYGTLSEVAYGLHFGKPVIGLEGAPEIDGVIQITDADAAVDAVLEALLFNAAYPDSIGECKFSYMKSR